MRRPAARSRRCSSAARIEIGFAFHASLMRRPPPAAPAPGCASRRTRRRGATRKLQAERTRGGQRAQPVHGQVARGEADLDLAERRAQMRRIERLDAHVLADPHDVEIVPRDREVGGDDRGAAGRQRLDQLALGADDPFQRADLLEMHRPDGDDDADLGPGQARPALRSARSPRMASSVMQISVSGSSRHSVSGTPISLLKLRSAATVGRCGIAIEARMSLVVVLP